MSESILLLPQGGLGNQLFQYMAALAVSNALGGQIWIAPVENKHSGTDYRGILFTKGRALKEVPARHLIPPLFYEQGSAFAAWSPELFRGSPFVALKGYFQNLPPLQPVLGEFRHDMLKILEPIRLQLAAKYNLTMHRRCAFIHVRRGDYTTLDPKMHWTHSPEYYLQGIQEIEQRTQKGLHWYILSDDLDWCRKNIWFQDRQIQFIDETNELISLTFMSMCKGGAVISNSTFSWWGAVLAAPPYVVYPRRWYKMEKPDLFPQNWIASGEFPTE